MKKIISTFTLLVILISTLTLTSCGFFVSENDGTLIDRIEKTAEYEDGSSDLTIYYVDGSNDVVHIPAGKEGEEGAGIDGFVPDPVEDGTKITVSFTDGREDVVFNVKDEKTVTRAETYTNEEGVRMLGFFGGDELLCETEFPELSGITGIGKDYTVDDEGNVSFWIECNQIDDYLVEIPAGHGIKNISAETKEDGYYIYVEYTHDKMGKNGDGKDEFKFDKPNAWFSGGVGPDGPDATEGNVGDFWFDDENAVIYVKNSNGWKSVVGFNDLVNKHVVTFNYNYPEDYFQANGLEKNPTKSIRDIVHGTYLNSTDIPVPEDIEGYTFCGWYKVRDNVNTAVMSAVTDMTSINDSMTLYALWVEE